MDRGRLLSGRPWLLLAVVGLLGLAVVTTAATAGASGTRGTIAKKCKKKRSAASAKKKKKCKRKRIVLPTPGPLVRGTLTWNGDNDFYDLHAFDASGNHTGWVSTGVVQGIPNAVHSGDVNGVSGTETFTDNIFVQGGTVNREFSYVACLYDTATATFTGVTKTGASNSVPLTGPGFYSLTVPGGPPIPGSPC